MDDELEQCENTVHQTTVVQILEVVVEVDDLRVVMVHITGEMEVMVALVLL